MIHGSKTLNSGVDLRSCGIISQLVIHRFTPSAHYSVQASTMTTRPVLVDLTLQEPQPVESKDDSKRREVYTQWKTLVEAKNDDLGPIREKEAMEKEQLKKSLKQALREVEDECLKKAAHIKEDAVRDALLFCEKAALHAKYEFAMDDVCDWIAREKVDEKHDAAIEAKRQELQAVEKASGTSTCAYCSKDFPVSDTAARFHRFGGKKESRCRECAQLEDCYLCDDDNHCFDSWAMCWDCDFRVCENHRQPVNCMCEEEVYCVSCGAYFEHRPCTGLMCLDCAEEHDTRCDCKDAGPNWHKNKRRRVFW